MRPHLASARARATRHPRCTVIVITSLYGNSNHFTVQIRAEGRGLENQQQRLFISKAPKTVGDATQRATLPHLLQHDIPSN